MVSPKERSPRRRPPARRPRKGVSFAPSTSTGTSARGNETFTTSSAPAVLPRAAAPTDEGVGSAALADDRYAESPGAAGVLVARGRARRLSQERLMSPRFAASGDSSRVRSGLRAPPDPRAARAGRLPGRDRRRRHVPESPTAQDVCLGRRSLCASVAHWTGGELRCLRRIASHAPQAATPATSLVSLLHSPIRAARPLVCRTTDPPQLGFVPSNQIATAACCGAQAGGSARIFDAPIAALAANRSIGALEQKGGARVEEPVGGIRCDMVCLCV
jgi:hypothetical protein